MGAKSRQTHASQSHGYHRCVVAVLLILLGIPVLATLLYSLSQHWGATVLPDGLTLDWYWALLHEPRFLSAFGHSLLVALATLVLATLLVVPAAFVVFYYFPRLDRAMNLLILLQFAVPPVVSSVGLLQLYADGPLPLAGTPWILVGCYFTIVLPFIYRALASGLQGMQVRDLMDAAHLLGASTTVAFLRVILPNLRKGLMAALFLSFSFLLGEFVFANMLVGGRFETLNVYLYTMRSTSGHFTSAVVMTYFLFTLIVTWIATRLSR
ncbi:ABC transporter permease [Actimicrobium antarcticum]|uniref:ABC transporter permease n=1 Tax=Actimicrobium antarcticum TaxID=1051899 RepID=A0ABP7TZX6_9BURK